MGIGDTLRSLAFGQDPEDVQLPSEVGAAQEFRQGFAERLRKRREAPTAGELVRKRGEEQLAALGRNVQSRVAGTRGPGRLLAERAATGALARGGAELGARTAAEAAEAERREVQTTEAQELELQRLLAEGAITEEELREARAAPGLFSTAATAAGGLIGAKFGGPGGAQTGGQIGQAVGRFAQRRLR